MFLPAGLYTCTQVLEVSGRRSGLAGLTPPTSICCRWHAPAHLARWLRVLSLRYAAARLCRHTHEIRCNQSTFGRPPPCRATIRLSWQRGACVPAACCLAHTEPLRPGAESSRGELATVSRVVRCNRSVAAQELGPVCRPTALRACVYH